MKRVFLGSYERFILGIQDHSVDMILTDPPYGKTKLSWDYDIDLEFMWKHFLRIVKRDGAIVLTSAQPFTSKLVSSNPQMFRQELIWAKGKGTDPLLANRRPMSAHENVLVFYREQPTYNPQYRSGEPYKAPRTGGNRTNSVVGSTSDKRGFKQKDNSGRRHPISVLDFSIHCGSKLVPTQKPVGLFAWLIRTHTKKGDLVLDPFAGSGTTAIACLQESRKYLLVENNEEHYMKIRKRIRQWKSEHQRS